MLPDFHLHSNFSTDSDASPESMIEAAINSGMKYMCFTDHQDFDFVEEPGAFMLDYEKYYTTLLNLKKKYSSDINIMIGVETGLEPYLKQRLDDFIANVPYDFVIGSTHLINRVDPYFPSYFESRTEKVAYTEYFNTVLNNLDHLENYDVVGHIDYIVRYGPNKNKDYSYDAYKELLDSILIKIINMNKGIEINTGGFKAGLGQPNPCADIIRRYYELGGRILTFGSDAHTPKYIGYEFDKAREIAISCGFTEYSIFKNRKPEFLAL